MAGKGKDEELEEEVEETTETGEVDEGETDEEEEEKKEAEEKKEDKKPAASKRGGKSFNQKQVSKMMANEKRQGKASVFHALGIDPDDAETIEAVKSLVAERKQAQAAGNDGEEVESEYQERALIAEAKVDAMVLGCQPKYVDDVVTLALAKAADDGSDFKTVVGELKTKYPDWFSNVDEDGDEGESKKKKSGTGSSMKKSAKRSKDGDGDQSLGARLAAQRVSKSGQQKKSYWS